MAKSDRIDPKPRPVSGGHTWSKLEQRDPNRHYVWVNMADQHQGPDYYSSIGYDVELQRPGGVNPVGGRLTRKNGGERFEFRGHLLMSCTLERKAEIDRDGADGDSGQRGADVLENKMIDRKRGIDLLRGIGFRGDEGIYHQAEKTHNVHVEGG